jgi:uncharacterized protein (DUF58 family)
VIDTRELLARVRRIEIRTRRLVNELTGGAYHSAFKGQGMEFEEVREYTYGDDVRSIDWNVTARTGQAFIKKFVEERELTVALLVDVSASGDFGSTQQRKNELAAELAALIAFSAIRNQDRVSLQLFTDRDELHLPARKGRGQVLRLVRELLAFERTRPGTNIRSALERFTKATHRRAVVFLISDFFDADYEHALLIANKRHDLIAIRVTDPCEHEIAPIGFINLEDAESGRRQLYSGLFNRKELAGAYREEAAARHRAATEACRRAGVDLIDVSTGQDYLKPLMQFFRTREHRRR